MQPSEVVESEVTIGSQESYPLPFQYLCADPIIQEMHKFPPRSSSSPSCAEILKKKLVDSSGSSNEDSIEQSSKNAGRKSHRGLREEEMERLKM